MNLAEFFKHDFSKGEFEIYDENGKIIFHENSDKFWSKYEYDENGNKTFYEDSNGYTYGTPKSKEIEMTVKELQDLISEKEGKNIKLKIKE